MYGITETTVHVSYLALDQQTATVAANSLIGRESYRICVCMYWMEACSRCLWVCRGALHCRGGPGAGLSQSAGFKRGALCGRSLWSAWHTDVPDRGPGPVAC